MTTSPHSHQPQQPSSAPSSASRQVYETSVLLIGKWLKRLFLFWCLLMLTGALYLIFGFFPSLGSTVGMTTSHEEVIYFFILIICSVTSVLCAGLWALWKLAQWNMPADEE